MPLSTADDVDVWDESDGVGDVVTQVNAKPLRYEMRAWRALSSAFILWRHTSKDTTGDFSGFVPATLTQIKFLRTIPAGEP